MQSPGSTGYLTLLYSPTAHSVTSINLLPVAQRNNALTYGVVGRTRVFGREFECHHPLFFFLS